MEETAPKSGDKAAPPNGPGVGPGGPPAKRSTPLRRWLIIAVALLLLAGGGIFYWRSTAWESTDNAQIDGFVFPVSSRVAGQVDRVMVDDNQFVEAGTVLVRLDPKDYDVAVAVAKANVANDEATAAALTTGVPITSTDTSSQITVARADIDNANAGLAVARRQFD